MNEKLNMKHLLYLSGIWQMASVLYQDMVMYDNSLWNDCCTVCNKIADFTDFSNYPEVN